MANDKKQAQQPQNLPHRELNDLKQTVGPVMPNANPTMPVLPAVDGFRAESERFLTSAGWKKMGTNDRGYSLWRDPVGKEDQTAVRTKVGELKTTGGSTEAIYQMVGPPIVWDYTSDEAMLIQNQRDMAAKEKEEKAAA